MISVYPSFRPVKLLSRHDANILQSFFMGFAGNTVSPQLFLEDFLGLNRCFMIKQVQPEG